MDKINTKINVCLAVNDKYSRDCAVTIQSLLENSKETNKINIYLMYQILSDENKKKIRKIVKQFNTKIYFIFVKKDLTNKFPDVGYFGKECYFRLLFPELKKKINKVIYLDTDILVLTDIKKLLEETQNKKKDVYGVLTIPPKNNSDKNYINSGILTIECKNWRKRKYLSKIKKYLISNFNKIKFPDQDAINKIIKNKGILHPRWNLQTNFLHKINDTLLFKENRLNEARKNPFIIHFTGEKKPWRYECVHPFKKKYIEYLNKTPYKEDYEKNARMKIKFKVIIKKIIPLHIKTKLHFLKSKFLTKNNKEII